MRRTIRRSTIAAAIAVTVTATALAGCQTLPGRGSGGDPNHVTIMVGGLDKVIYLPAELTARLGNFTAQGLTVDLQTQPSGANAETALVAGQVDAVVGFYDHTIDLQTKGKCLRSVVQFANVPGEVEIAGKNAPIAGVADLRGKKLGVTSPGSSTDFLTQYLTGKAGITPDAYTTVTAGAGATFVAAIQNGGIDAGMTTDPTTQQITDRNVGRILLDMRDEAGTRAALGGLYPSSSLYMDCAYVDSHADTVRRLARAFVTTLHYIHDRSPAEIAAAMPPDYASGNGGAAQYTAAIEASRAMFNVDGRMPAGGAENVLAVLGQADPNVRGRTGSVDLSRTYTTEFVQG